MNGSIKFVLALAAMAFGQQVSAESSGSVAALLAQDVRLATVAERLFAANNHLCRQHMPLTGMVLHSRDQYRAGLADAQFGNGQVAIAGVVPGSAAERAGLRAGDGLVAIAGRRTADLVKGEEEASLRDAAQTVLAAQPAREPVQITVARGGEERVVSLDAPEGCRAQVEIRSTNDLNALATGRLIRLTYGLAVRADDNALAVLFAHEMGHHVLEHRRRLEAAGVEKGLLGEFGKNHRLNRLVETQADQMAVHLLANAGYDPSVAPAFWRTKFGRRVSGGLFGRSTYNRSASGRAELQEREIAEHIVAGRSDPEHLLAGRDRPFD